MCYGSTTHKHKGEGCVITRDSGGGGSVMLQHIHTMQHKEEGGEGEIKTISAHHKKDLLVQLLGVP